jgi:cob(I)alamin adenosyltransferase
MNIADKSGDDRSGNADSPGNAYRPGDDGYTEIIGGSRLPKDHPILECLGAFDELNAFLGDAKAALTGKGDSAGIINAIQNDLIRLMGIIAGTPLPAEGIGEDRLDGIIRKLEAEMPPFTSFSVPGANPVSAKLHIARTVCRRAERRLVTLGGETAAAACPYMNRLSDLLFLLAQKES